MVKHRFNSKQLTPLIPFVVLLLVLYWTKDFLFSIFKSDKPQGTTLNSDSVADGSDLYTGFNAEFYAKQLFDEMRDWETSHEPVMNILRQMNGSELIATYNAFGKPKYFMGQEAAFFGNDLDLIGWLKAELSPADLTEARNIFESKTTLKF